MSDGVSTDTDTVTVTVRAFEEEGGCGCTTTHSGYPEQRVRGLALIGLAFVARGGADPV